MGIRSKFFVVIGPLMIVVVLFIYSVISGRFLDQFSDIELDLAKQNVDRALNAIDGLLEDVNTKSSDWAQWDDSYAFMQDHNQEYWQSNLSNDSILDGMKLSVMVFVDRSGHVVATKNALDADSDSDAVPQDILDALLDGRFVNYDDGAAFHKGIVHIGDIVLLVASRPIMRTDGTGPAAGTIIFARTVDDALIREISDRIHLPLKLYASTEVLPLEAWQKEVLADEGRKESVDVAHVEGDIVAAYGAVHDVSGGHTIFTRIEIPRTIYRHGQGFVRSFSIFFGVAFVIFSITLMLLLEWLVFAPISRLSADVDRIRSGDDDAMRIKVTGNDQFSHLSETINQMIDGLYRMRQQKEESESRFQTVADLAPVMIWMSGADKQYSYFNKGWLDFTGRSADEELGNGWAKGVHPDDIDQRTAVYSKAFDARESFRMEYRLRNTSGEYRWVLDSGIPNFAPDGTFLGYLGSCIDITERRMAEESNTKRIKEMETLNKMMVSRELKMIELKKELQRLKQ
ncbi:MAG: CHASE4 domain-containing protein [Candidatus Moranbacteria bacterium]|nr:CHASE4 domain-containing protein [Candidatus Moranbacteria bacterium]